MYKDTFEMKTTYGRGEGQDTNGAVDIIHYGASHQIVVDIDFDKNGFPDVEGLTIRSAHLPKGAAVLSAKLVVKHDAAVNGTTVDVGTCSEAGLAIDEDGLIAAQALQAGVIEGAGAQVKKVLTLPGYIKITPSATGASNLGGLKALLIIEYV